MFIRHCQLLLMKFLWILVLNFCFRKYFVFFLLWLTFRFHGYHKLTSTKALGQLYTPTQPATKPTNYTAAVNVSGRGGSNIQIKDKQIDIQSRNVLQLEQPRTSIFTGIFISGRDGKKMVKTKRFNCLNINVCLLLEHLYIYFWIIQMSSCIPALVSFSNSLYSSPHPVKLC